MWCWIYGHYHLGNILCAGSIIPSLCSTSWGLIIINCSVIDLCLTSNYTNVCLLLHVTEDGRENHFSSTEELK